MKIEEVNERLQHFFNEDDYAGGERFLHQILEEKRAPHLAGKIAYHLGQFYFLQGDPAEGRKWLIRALQEQPDHFHARFLLARTLELLGESEDALRLYADCLAARPNLTALTDFPCSLLNRKAFKDSKLSILPEIRSEGPENPEFPKVSILILGHNKAEYSEKCLAALYRNTADPNYEVVFVDNGSVDETPALLEIYSQNIRAVRARSNLGFVGGNNLAATHARGEFLVFLNNDTEVQPGWLSNLRRCFQIDPRAGAVGAMLLFPNSTVQEAGGIIFRDGTGWNYGRGSQVFSSFLFAREVDYCSGAALMVRKDLFEKLGGFDRRFAPAYYEDTDLCFGIRKLGYKVIYCPEAKVLHHEGVTAGKSLNGGYKKYQSLNRPKFQEKWKKELADQPLCDPQRIRQLSDRRKGRRILMIDETPPLPDRAAGSLRLYHTVHQMVHLGFQVTYVFLFASPLDAAAQDHLKDFRLRGVEFIHLNYESWGGLGDPAAVKAAALHRLKSLDLANRNFQAVYICFWHVASRFVEAIRKLDPDVPIIVDSMDIHYLRKLREAEVKKSPALKKEALQTKEAELAVYREADGITTVTEADRTLLKKELPQKPIFIMTDVHDPVKERAGFETRAGFLFVGNFNHNPNEDAAIYLVETLFPLIQREIPEAVLFIVGNNPPSRIQALASDKIIVTGWVPEMKPFLQKCRVEVVPLRYGAGNKGKVGEAFAHGLPMVMTSIGAEGMNIIHGQHAYVTDDPKQFAEYAVELYRNRPVWENFSQNGETLVAAQYSSKLMRKRLEYLMSYSDRKAFLSHRALKFSSPPEVSLVVLTEGNFEETRKSLSALEKYLQTSNEMIIPIRHSGEGFPKRLQIAFPGARLYRSDADAFAEQANEGLVQSQGNWILVFPAGLDLRKEGSRILEEILQAAPLHLTAFEGEAATGKGKSIFALLVPKEAVKILGGFDEGFLSLSTLFQDFMARARFAGFGVDHFDKDALFTNGLDGARGRSLETEADEKAFRRKWEFASPSSRPSGPGPSPIPAYPVAKDKLVENSQRVFLHLAEKNYERAKKAMIKALKAFPSSEHSGKTLEYPRLLCLAAEIAGFLGKADEQISFLHEAYHTAPGDEKVARAYAMAFVENAPVPKSSHDRPSSPIPFSPAEDEKKKEDGAPLPEKAPSPLTSIVILTCNEIGYTKICVESIRKHTPEPHEIIFVDNGSKDETRRWLRKRIGKDSNCRLIENDENLGFAKGCNQGVQAAKGDTLLLLNNDVVVTEGWLAGMQECLASSPQIGIVGPMTNQISGIQKIPNPPYPSVEHLDEFARTFREKNRHRRIPSRRIVGFCMLFRRELVERIGLLDDRFGTGNFEDDDFCLRAELEGYANMIAGDVFIHHYGSRSFIGNRIDYGSSMSGNRKIFSKKWNGSDANSPAGRRLLSLQEKEAAWGEYYRDRLEKAAEDFLRALKICPQDENIYLGFTDMLLDAKRYQEGFDILKQLPFEKKNDQIHARLGYCMEGLGKIVEADEFAEQALSANPGNALALNLKGTLAYRRGEKEEAVTVFQRAIQADPGYGEPYTNLGVMKWESGDKEEALNNLERGFILSPAGTDHLRLYHAAASELGAFERAEHFLVEAEALYPGHKKMHYFLVDALLRQGKDEAAMARIEKGIVHFGLEEGLIRAALEVRKRVGPKEIPGKKERGTISLCMIVKNEEKFLAKCLQSVKTIVDEMVIVDTGSSDRTKDLATIFGAKVFDFAWGNDFSAARNYSLAEASGDWILVLDADEAISPSEHPLLRELTSKKRGESLAYSFVTRNYVNGVDYVRWTPNDGTYQEEAGSGWFPGEKVRLFLRGPQICFENPVHEVVEPTLARHRIPISKCPVPIHHFGKLDAEKTRRKGKAYLALGKRKLEETGSDLQSLKELAVQAGNLGRQEEAIDLWNQVIDLCPHCPEAHLNLSSNFIKINQYRKAAAASKKAMELDPSCQEATINYALSQYFMGNCQEIKSCLEPLAADESVNPLALGLLSLGYILNKEREKCLPLVSRIKDMGYNFTQYLETSTKELISGGQEAAAKLLLDFLNDKSFAARDFAIGPVNQR